MKFKNIKNVSSNAVSGQVDVTFEIDKTEANDLRAALAIVDKYKNAALSAIESETKFDPESSDWCMISYCVKNDKAIISVQDGMTG